jgi:hypothetical protein
VSCKAALLATSLIAQAWNALIQCKRCDQLGVVVKRPWRCRDAYDPVQTRGRIVSGVAVKYL